MLMQLSWMAAVAYSALIVIQMAPLVHAAKILIVAFPQPSHVMSKFGIAVELIRQGHEVHIALPTEYPHKDSVKNAGIHPMLHQQLPGVLYPFSADYEQEIYDVIFNRDKKELDILRPICQNVCRSYMEDEDFIRRVKNENYSLVLTEPFVINPCFLIVPYSLGIPFISIASTVVPLSFRLPALPSFYSIIRPGPDLIDFWTMQTFGERLSSTIMTAFFKLIFKPKFWGDTTLLQKYAPDADSWEQLMVKSEMVLVENDHNLDNFLPLLPHVVTIAGCSARPAKPLPESLEKIVEQSENNGIILASFGTLSHHMPSHIAIKFLNAFGRLNQTVLTKMAVPPGVSVSSLILHVSNHVYFFYSCFRCDS
jgi:hypothetical protein